MSIDISSFADDGFSFTGVSIDKLRETEYTLVTVLLDITGSMSGFEQQLADTARIVVEATKKSPRASNVLLRLCHFNTKLTEVHGFIPVPDIDQSSYKAPKCDDLTALYDAIASSVTSTSTYAAHMANGEFLTNTLLVAITDGDDNRSGTNTAGVKAKLDALRRSETESVTTILIGLGNNISGLKDKADEMGFDHYIEERNLDAGTLAKVAGLISQSISSSSQALGTGGPSQQIPASLNI